MADKSCTLLKLTFDGDPLEMFLSWGAWVVLRRVCDALGLQPERQQARLEKAPWAETLKIPLRRQDGTIERELLCVSLETLGRWLATLRSSQVRSDLHEKLTLYQRSCCAALDEQVELRRLPLLWRRLERLERALSVAYANRREIGEDLEQVIARVSTTTPETMGQLLSAWELDAERLEGETVDCLLAENEALRRRAGLPILQPRGFSRPAPTPDPYSRREEPAAVLVAIH